MPSDIAGIQVPQYLHNHCEEQGEARPALGPLAVVTQSTGFCGGIER